MKLRLPGRRDPVESSAASAPDGSADPTEQLVKAGGKGRPTPKRAEAQGRRPGPPPPPPTTRKEAYRRMREQQAARRASGGPAAGRGDGASLPARDRGPVRKLVRDVVDARRNAGSFFLLIAVIVMAGYFISDPRVQGYTVMVWLAFFLVVVGDSFLLGCRIKKMVVEL